MNILLTLTVSCMTLALCQAACFQSVAKPVIKNGVVMNPDGCIDIYDNTRHPSGTGWNTAHCKHCSCRGSEMTCCDRYGGVVNAPGCNAVVDPETCSYKFYKIDNPSEPCFGDSETPFIRGKQT